MDEVLEKLEGALISQDSNSNNLTSYEGLYKNWGRLGNQEARRKEILEVQKGNRQCKLDKFRGILNLVNAAEESEIFSSSNKKVYYRPSIYVAGFNKTSHSYSDVLMMSEWIIEKPENLADWYLVPCPKGVRMLVVANSGKTKCYTKYGHFRYENRTALPGGNPCDPKRKSSCCVLDCFYQESLNTMFILDLLAWNNQPMTDGEAEFRHFWLQSQLAEIPGLNTISKKNEIIFKLLPKVPCTPDAFNDFMNSYPMFENNTPSLDGILFYHKRAHYVSGETPLVGWLFPYMVPEILGSEYKVNPHYMLEKPKDYVSQAEFIQAFEAKMSKKKSRSRRTSTNIMDTAETEKNTAEAEAMTEQIISEEKKSPETMEADGQGDGDKNKEQKSTEIMESDTEDLSSNKAKEESNTVPRDQKRKEEWIKCIRLLRKETDWLPSTATVVCSNHFKDQDFMRARCY